MRYEYILVIWSCIRNKGEVSREWFNSSSNSYLLYQGGFSVVVLLSLYVRLWLHVWCLLSFYQLAFSS